jgi:C4-dicarboxylate-specific signal transduction histidine kinase
MEKTLTPTQPSRLVAHQLRWLVGLRWIAGSMVVAGSLLDAFLLRWHDHALGMTGVGIAILCYNNLLLLRVRRGARSREAVGGASIWLHILPDLVCLALLTAWTGGAQSPLLGFFVFHMVFTSMLLAPVQAYGWAAAAALLLTVCLEAFGRWPQLRSDRLILIGWVVTLVLTVYLTNQITAALRRHRARLIAQNRRNRVLVNTLRRQQQAMIQQEKMVGLGQMAAGVAHEVSNPLASMDGVLQLMQRNERHIKPENIETLRQQVQRIKQTVRQLTDFAHPTEYHWEKVPINSVIESAMQMVRFDHRQRAVAIEKKFAEENTVIEVQTHALQQVLTNLLFNALDALAEVKNPALEIGAACDGSACRVWVRDNGPGVPPEHLDRVFEPFFTTKPVGKGTGLGLAICYNLIRNQGGRIEFVSKPGQGVTATIHLPVRREVAG